MTSAMAARRVESGAGTGNGAYILDALCRGRCEAEHVAAPDPCLLLLFDDALGRLPRLNGGVFGFKGLESRRSRRREFGMCSVTDNLSAMGQQPCQRNSVVVR